MGNNELTKHFLSMQTVSGLMPEVAYFDIVKALNQYTSGNWAWELISETFAMDNSVIAVTVQLYIPGHVFSGRATCPVKEFANAHLYALVDAAIPFTSKSGVNPNQQPQSPPSGNMSADQIMNAINGNGGNIDSSAQFYNHKDANGVQSDSVPFDGMSDKAHQELQNEMGMGNAMNPPQQPDNSNNSQQNNDEYNRPQEKLNGYSQSQIDRIAAFKKKWDVMNNDMFNNYVRMWNKDMTKKDLNPQNIEQFLAWADTLGK